jgi:glycosyltransferase involved in cell wall biosynthesis
MRCDIDVFEGLFSIRWAFKNAGRIGFFHFHWPSFFYAYRSNRRKTLKQFYRFLLFLIAIKLKGSHVLWTAHNLYPHDRGGMIFLDVWTRHIMVRLSSKIFVHGASARRKFVEEFPAAKRKVVEIDHGNWINFYPNEIDQNRARNQLGVQTAPFIFLFIGLCKEYKNLIQLVESFKALRDDSILLIAGKFQSRRFYQKLRNAANTDLRIRIYNGFIQNRDLQIYLNACDFVVLPYVETLTSGAAMLALSFGRPVISLRQGNLIDIVSPSCGILYDSGAPDALKTAMMEARKRKFSRNAIINHAALFSWDKTANIFQHTMKQLQK